MSSPSVAAPGQLMQDQMTYTPETVLYKHYLTTLDDRARKEVVQRERDSGLDTPTFAALTMSALPFDFFEGFCRESGCSPNQEFIPILEEAIDRYNQKAPETNIPTHGQVPKLNGFMAFRSWFSRLFIGSTQAQISTYVSALWAADLHHDDWALLAAAYNALREDFVLQDTSLSTYLTYTVNFFYQFPFDTKVYLRHLGFQLQPNDINSPLGPWSLKRVGHASRFPPPAIKISVESILDFCENLGGYAHRIPGQSWRKFSEQGKQPSWSVGDRSTDLVQAIFNQSALSIEDVYDVDDGTVSNRDMIQNPDRFFLWDMFRQQFMDDFLRGR